MVRPVAAGALRALPATQMKKELQTSGKAVSLTASATDFYPMFIEMEVCFRTQSIQRFPHRRGDWMNCFLQLVNGAAHTV
jgi:hypothetical protein